MNTIAKITEYKEKVVGFSTCSEHYLYISKKQLVNIKCPLDDLWKREEISIAKISSTADYNIN